ncbi:MAG: hypothetical protein Q9191_001258 [Dirinaria sp. TL-2023a]
MLATTPMASRTAASFNAVYNPQQWGPLSGGSPNSTRAGLGRERHAGQTPRLAPRPVGPDEPVASPPPPYSPRRDETSEPRERNMVDIASPADTISPDSDPSRYSTPISAATTVSPDFAPRNFRRSPLAPSQPFASESPIIAQDATFPPPPPSSKSSNRNQSTSKSHTDWLMSSLRSRNRAASTTSPASAIDTLQQDTAQAIARSPDTTRGNPTITPPAARRAASTGFIGSHSRTPPSARRSPSQSAWEPGMPLPPPPPGPPPPSMRSQSLNRPPYSSSSGFDSASGTAPRPRREPGLGSKLGPVPPTPADWNDGEEEPHQQTWRGRSNGPSQLHIDTGSILKDPQDGADQLSAAPNTSRQRPLHLRRDSSCGALARSPAVRNRSAKGIRERRSESRNGKGRATEDLSHPISSDPYNEASSPQNIRPTDLILPSQGTISKRRIDAKSPRSGKDTLNLNGPLSGSEARTPTSVQSRVEFEAPSLSTLSKSPSLTKDSASTSRSEPYPSTKLVPTLETKGNANHMNLIPSANRNHSEARPISHILHMPNTEGAVQAPLLPQNPPTEEIQTDLLGPESPRAFAQRANERHRIFADREAAAVEDAEKMTLFVQFVLTESRIRQEQYKSFFKTEDCDVEGLMNALLGQGHAPNGTKDVRAPEPLTKVKQRQSIHASSASESSAQGSLWQADSTVSSQKQSSPITVSSENSSHLGPEPNGWKEYVPCLSPIASMSVVTGQDEMDSRGRAPSRWWEDRSGESAPGDAFNVLGRTKRESKYMGVSKEARDSPAFLGSSIAAAASISDGLQDKPLQNHDFYAEHEYPPEKVGWHEEATSFSLPTAHPSTPQSAPYTPDPRKLDVSRLVTLPPPYPRHYPAVNNSHPDLSDERAVVRSLNDFSEAIDMRKSYELKVTEKRQRAESWRKHHQSLHEQEMQFQMEHGEISQEEFDQAESEIERKIFQSEREIAQAEFDLFQSLVVSPLHALFSERIDKANSSLDKLSSRLFSDSQQHSPNLPQEEGDEHAELLEKLTQLKWLFEARENLHRETFNLLSERNDKYKAIVLLPYQQTKTLDKIAEAESFFTQDERERSLAFEQAAASRSDAFLAVVESNVVRGVEIQLSAFWDIAPSLLQILQRIPPGLGNFEIHIPAAEYADNPTFYRHPMQYLYSLLTHAEKSSYQFIESQINLLCLLHEIRSLALAARSKAEEGNAREDGSADKTVVWRETEEQALMDDLKEKVAVVEGQWVYLVVAHPLKGFHTYHASKAEYPTTVLGHFDSTQYPPTTTVSVAFSAKQALKDRQTVSTGLESGGRPSVQPFPTPSVTQPVIQFQNFPSNVLSPSGANFSSRPVLNIPFQNISNYSRPAVTALIAATSARRETMIRPRQPSPEYSRFTGIFEPIATGVFPGQITSRDGHPVPRLGIVG